MESQEAGSESAEVETPPTMTPLPILLLAAAKNGDTEVIRTLLLKEGGASIEVKDKDGCTMLHLAAAHGQLETTKLLVEAGANKEAKDTYHRTPLHEAANGGQTETAKFLIQRGVIVEAKDRSDRTPLHMGAEKGHTETVMLLIEEAGASIEARDEDDCTPLHNAAMNGHTETTKLLIQAGANVEPEDLDEATPLHKTAAQGHSEIVKLLIEAGADVEAMDENGSTPLHKTADRGGYLRTTLLEAEIKGFTDTAKLLIDSGANVDAKDENDRTAHQVAVSNYQWEVAELLLANGAKEYEYRPSDFTIHRDKLLGQGSFGKVYKARDHVYNRDVAVKVCQATRNARSDLEKESKLLRTLKHKNIVQHIFYHFDETQSEHQVFMELGESKRQQNIEGFQAAGDLQELFRETLTGLAYLHSQKVLHRDIKPENLLGSPGRATGRAWSSGCGLADFGCSISLSDHRVLGGSIATQYVEGTLPYMAPEVFKGHYSEGSDLWALACTVLEMATGQRPWHEVDKRGRELQQHIQTSGTHPSFSRLSDEQSELKDLLTKMIHQDPAQRGTADSALEHPYFKEDQGFDKLSRCWKALLRPEVIRAPTEVTAVTSRFVTISSDDD